ncbi:ATP-binding cassette domain-containing protein [Luedemannella flava]
MGPLVLVAVLAAGGLGALTGRITPGELFAASRYAVLGAGLGALTGALGRLARARAGVARAAEVLGVEPLRYGSRTLPDRCPGGRLELRDVTVRAGAARLLDGVNLTVPAGALVAVVGRSGSGKSTLAAIATRLRDPDAGEVLLDDVPMADLSHDALRAAVGCAFERPTLVGHTVADALGDNLHRVRAAAGATHAHDFISRLPDGYATPLARTPLSGGETQRLGLARAWPARRLLVLDDATSSVDIVTGMRIASALASGRGARTTVVVTHRPTAAAGADLVVWLAAGSVRAVAPHADLWPDPDYRAVFA